MDHSSVPTKSKSSRERCTEIPKLTSSATGLFRALSCGTIDALRAADSCVKSSNRFVSFLS